MSIIRTVRLSLATARPRHHNRLGGTCSPRRWGRRCAGMVYGEGSHGVRRVPGFSFVRRIGCARHIRRWPAPGRLPVLPAPHPSFQQQPGIYDYGATRYGRSDRPPALQGRPSHQRPSLAGSPARSDCILRWHRTISRALAICRDPLFTFLQALGVYLAIRALYDPRVRWPLLCGIAIGLSFWVRNSRYIERHPHTDRALVRRPGGEPVAGYSVLPPALSR